MTEKKIFSLDNRLKSFAYAFEGLKTFFRNEPNSWIHLTVAITAIVLGKLFCLNFYEWCLIIFAIALVLMAEIFNTAIELLTDMISPDRTSTAKKVKDMAAAAVLISSIAAFLIGLLVFIPKLPL